MERYSEYKDSGVKWLGEIPSHWEVVRGLAVFSENKNKNTQLENSIVLSLSYGKIIVKKDIDSGLVPEEYSSYQIVKPGFIIVRSTDLQNDKTSLRIGYVCNEGIITSAYLGLQVKGNNNDKYLYYFLHDWDITKEIYRHGNGLRQSLSWNDLRDVNVLLPPLSEQDAIVRYIDAATSKIDKAIAMQQKMIDLLNERKQIIIQNAVTKGLDDKVEMKESGVEWTEFFPNSWSIKKVKYIFEFISTKEVASNRTFNIALENIVAHSGNYIDTNSEYEASGVSFRKNDILFGKLRPYLAKVHLCERAGIALGDIFVLRPLSGFDSSFLRYLLISEKFIQYVDSSTYGAKMPRANWDFIGNIYVAYPTLDKQRDISKYLNKEMQRFDSAISNCQRQIALLQERKQIIINEVVTGKVKVS